MPEYVTKSPTSIGAINVASGVTPAATGGVVKIIENPLGEVASSGRLVCGHNASAPVERGMHIGYPVPVRIVGLFSSIVKRESGVHARPNLPSGSLIFTRCPVP